jgi:glyoxylase-like metal-dependent hydrolase (beta-lactamase superfamily II)
MPVSAQTVDGYYWQEVGPEIFVHGRTDALAGPIDGTSTVILYEDGVLVVDTHINPAATRALIAEIRGVTDKPVTHVVNTHWHDDHVNGNYVFRDAFPDVRIMAHSETVRSLEEEWEAMEEQRRSVYSNLTSEQLTAYADSIEATSPDDAISYRVFAGYIEALKPELDQLRLVHPDVIIDDRVVVGTGGRTIIVEHVGSGNTSGDLIVWLPEDRVLVTGDMLVGPIPYAFDSPMGEWVETLTRIRDLDARLIIPGHGEVQRDAKYLDQVIALLRATLDAVAEMQNRGVEYTALADSIELSGFEQQFTQGDPILSNAWRSYYLEPGVRSAWSSLGFEVPSGAVARDL